ncbi:hypothetical protein CACET_c15650 [Clostridium aceticum]|uniref:Uncharacterized protein n=1 Tax=Clostridium aceticum TaxID=84022 RepID=A0A0D8ICV9_9CLOT|nr:hypothetical protein [Clostridium aceticum]AKL95014.1 hypothetical protein CACET_c15650 [Clostridium aceticum]KJF27914.1 hypothetical protein TZ02_04880 [Clostridium aceticum]
MSKVKIPQEEQGLGTVMYCGASLPNGILQQYTIFKKGFPKHVKQHMEKCPALRSMMVSPENIADVRKNIEILGTRENKLFKETVEYAKGVRE